MYLSSQGLTYLFEVLHWKFIFSQPYVGSIRIKTFTPTTFCNIFLTFAGNNLIVWNYSFLGSSSIYLFECSNISSRIKCEICFFEVSNISTSNCSGVFIINLKCIRPIIILFYFYWLWTCKCWMKYFIALIRIYRSIYEAVCNNSQK